MSMVGFEKAHVSKNQCFPYIIENNLNLTIIDLEGKNICLPFFTKTQNFLYEKQILTFIFKKLVGWTCLKNNDLNSKDDELVVHI